MTAVLSDLQLVLRTWVKTPGFPAIAILSIALGIGANAAVFTLVDQILLRALPVADPDALVHVSFTGHRYGNNWGDGGELSYPFYRELRDNNQVFEAMFARFGTALNIGAAGQTERAAGELVFYEVAPGDPLAMSAAVALLLAVSLAAGLVPSTRAARLNPTDALRAD